jgi:hypothetical protein
MFISAAVALSEKNTVICGLLSKYDRTMDEPIVAKQNNPVRRIVRNNVKTATRD